MPRIKASEPVLGVGGHLSLDAKIKKQPRLCYRSINNLRVIFEIPPVIVKYDNHSARVSVLLENSKNSISAIGLCFYLKHWYWKKRDAA